ncbi:DinB family protein [Oceanobacillus alkalisoli]|uniref:DinB family protein n=1 Tax=Oceanobacillus alkalisoli TaxID=2925113 RepID=UPI001EF00924|nr:DinB family protein [Oceanobacillus alkalisoli]MCF3944443.1 DinB family protein [Oceanobacillus alkalisoli]MCG5102096.1 DinB family protein [Oceanobacillus alkalisoli]
MSRKQFNLARTALINFIDDHINEETADVQAKPFNNTLRWHIGHVLVVDEKMLFRFPKKSDHIPENYADLFGPGTKPSDWTEEAPSLDELKKFLLDQQERLNNFDDLFWKTNVTFKVPFGSVETFGDLLIMLGHHETEHLGKMKAMLQVVNAEV